MNTNFTPSPQEELEARLTALLLGELSPDEAAALEAQIAGDAELQRVRREIEETIPFVKEALQPAADLKLSPERWAQMTKSFRIIQTDELGGGKKTKSIWRTAAALAAMVAALFVAIGAFLPALAKAKSKSVAARAALVDYLGEADEPVQNQNLIQPRLESETTVSEDRKGGTSLHFGIALPSSEPVAGDVPTEPQTATRGFGEEAAGPGSIANGRVDSFSGFDGGGGGDRGSVVGGRVMAPQGAMANQAPMVTPPPASAAVNIPNPGSISLAASDRSSVATSVPGAPAALSAAGVNANSAAAPQAQNAPEFQQGLGLNGPLAGSGGTQGSQANGYQYYRANPEALNRSTPQLEAKLNEQVGEGAKKDASVNQLQPEKRVYLARPARSKPSLVPRPNIAPLAAADSPVMAQNSEALPKLELPDENTATLGKEVRLKTAERAEGDSLALNRGLEREELNQKAKSQFTGNGNLQDGEVARTPASNEPAKTGGVYSVNAVGYANGSNLLDSADAATIIAKSVAPVPQPEVQTGDNAFSTFSLNVSDVSFKLAEGSLEKGLMPDAGGIRSEEFLNAFDYRDAEAMAAPVAFAWERARYPFAQDREVLRLSIKTAASGRQAGRPLNLVLLLDNSGSMERADRVQILRECLRTLTAQLTPADRVSVVTFARTARLAVDGLTGAEIGQLPQRVGALAPEGGTNLEEAMRLAYQTAQKHFAANGVNRVVMLTDGAANLGDVRPEALKQTVETQRSKGIALDCFGIGWDGLNDDLLETLSRNGDGRYGFVNTPEAAGTEFAGQLAGALKVAASDVKVQVEFNPKRVTAYRQIGYAKHQLTKEQFRDNTVDAAELGAAEAGNAVYIAQVNPRGEGPLGTVRARFKIPGTNDYREHEWPLTFDAPARPAAQANYSLRLATTAAAFSEWLASSPYAGEVTSDNLLQLMAGVPEFYTPDPRPKKLETMIREAKSIAGR